MVLSVGVGALGSAAAVVSRIGSAIDRAHTAAAPVTTTVAAAAGDEVSVAIAERRLLPAVRKMEPGDVLVATGTSCRHQVAELQGTKGVHPAVLIRDLLS